MAQWVELGDQAAWPTLSSCHADGEPGEGVMVVSCHHPSRRFRNPLPPSGPPPQMIRRITGKLPVLGPRATSRPIAVFCPAI